MISKRLHPASFSNVNSQLASIDTELYGSISEDSISNFLTHSNFDATTDWTAISGSIAASGNVLSVTGNGSNAAVQASQISTIPVAIGKKVYGRIWARVTNAICTSIQLVIDGSTAGTNQVKQITSPVQNQWYDISDLFTQPADVAGYVQMKVAHIYASAGAASGQVMELKYAVAIDVTEKYGSGNEPPEEYFDCIAGLTEYKWWNGSINISDYIPEIKQEKIGVIGLNNRIVLLQRMVSGKYVYFVYELKTGLGINLNSWRLNQIYIFDATNKTAYLINPDSSDIEGVIKISGEADFLGSVHGNEQLENIYLYLDGVSFGVTDDVNGVYSNVEFIVESTIYKYDKITQAFTRYKDTLFDHNGIHINNRWHALDTFTLDRVRLPVNAPKYSGSTKLFETYRDSVVNIKPVSVPAVSGSASDLVSSANLIDSEINGSALSVKSWLTARGGSSSTASIHDFGDRLKTYFDCYVGESVSSGSDAYAKYDYKIIIP